MAGGAREIGLRWEVGPELRHRVGGLLRQAPDPVPRHGRGRRTGLAGRSGRLAFRQSEDDAGDASVDEQEVDGYLTKPPVVVRAGEEVGVTRPSDAREESLTTESGRLGDEAQRLAHPLRAVGRFITNDKGHAGLILTACFPFV